MVITMKYTKQDIIRLVEEEDIEFIRMQFVDVFGTIKNLAVTSSQIEKILDNRCMFDGAAINGFEDENHKDYFLVPDLDTFEIFPWRPQQGKVARFLCDVLKADGTPFEGDSRYILKKVLAEAKEMGYSFHVGANCEFFLFHTDEEGEPTTQLSDKGEFFDIGPADNGENARREMVMFLEDMHFKIDSSYHSNAAGQHEIDFKYDTGLCAADHITTFKMVVRIAAKRHGLHATFMPKPKNGMKGSGMHLTMSLHKEEKNLFDGEKKGLISKEAEHFIAGILAHIEGMTLVNNPIVNSYKRLVPGFHAPSGESWSNVKRNCLIRVAAISEDGTKIVLRSPDAASNPYLVLALCLAAGLEGIKKKLEPMKRMEDNSEEKEKLLPNSLEEAIKAFEQDIFVQQVLGKKISEAYLKVKRAEWEEYAKEVTSWEIKKYLGRI